MAKECHLLDRTDAIMNCSWALGGLSLSTVRYGPGEGFLGLYSFLVATDRFMEESQWISWWLLIDSWRKV